MLRHPCILGGPQCQARGAKSEVVPNKGEQYQKWLPHPYLLGGPKEGRNATSPLHSQGSPMPSTGNNITSGPQQGRTKSEVAASHLPSPGPKRGRKCYVTPAFSGVPDAKRGEQNQKWSPTKENKIGSGCLTLALLAAKKKGRNATPPLHSRGSPTPGAGSKIRSGCLTPTFSGAKKRAEMLCHPCILGDSQQRGTTSEVAAFPLPCRGPKRGQKCYVTPAFSGVPNAKRGEQNQKWSPTKGEQNQKWLPHPCILWGPTEGGNATSPPHSRGSPTPSAGSKIRSVPQKRRTKSEVAASPLHSPGPKRGRKCYITPAFSGIPNAKRGEQNQKWSPTKENKIGSGCLTLALLAAKKRAEMLRHPCILGDPQRQAQGAKSEVVASPMPCRGPK